MMLAIRPPEYFPPIPVWAQMLASDVMVLGDTFQYSRQTCQNRAKIRTAEGSAWITIPVSYRFKDPIAAVRMDETDAHWARQHFLTLQNHYRTSAFFEFYEPELKAFWDTPCTYLADYAIGSIQLVHRLLGLRTPLIRVSELPETERNVVALLRRFGADAVLSLPEQVAADVARGFPVMAMDVEIPTYRQTYRGFEGGLSILDLLFNYGPESLSFLKNIHLNRVS